MKLSSEEIEEILTRVVKSYLRRVTHIESREDKAKEIAHMCHVGGGTDTCNLVGEFEDLSKAKSHDSTQTKTAYSWHSPRSACRRFGDARVCFRSARREPHPPQQDPTHEHNPNEKLRDNQVSKHI